MLESKVGRVKVGHAASACLPRFHRHSSYTIGCASSDWLRGWLCFFQPGGWQAVRHISPDCCISQSVRPQFLASVCLDEHHRNNKKDPGMSIIAQNVFLFFFPSQFCWQSSLHLDSCIIRGFCLVSSVETEDRQGCMGEKKKKTGILGSCGRWGGGGSLWCCSFMEAYNTLWYFISHLCSKKKGPTNICTHTQRVELPPSWRISLAAHICLTRDTISSSSF